MLTADYQRMHAQLLDMLGANDHEDAARIIAMHHAREMSTQEKAEPVAGPLLTYAVNFMDGWLEDEREEVLRNWSHVRKAALNQSATPAERVRVPDGWKLVPIRPTPLMVGEGAWTYRQVDGDIAQCYEAMVKTAPAVPAVPEGSGHD